MIMTKDRFFPFSEGSWSRNDYIDFSPDSRHLLAVSEWNSKLIRIWNISTGKLAQTLEGHKENVKYATFLPFGSHIISLSSGGELFLWNLKDGSYQNLAFIEKEIIQFSLSPDGLSLYLFDLPHSFQEINLGGNFESKYYTIAPIIPIEAVFPLGDILFLYVKDDQEEFQLYEHSSNDTFEKSSQVDIKVWTGRLSGPYHSISISKYGNYVAESICTKLGYEGEFERGETSIWDLNSNTLVRSFPLKDPSGFELSSNARYFSDGGRIWNVHSGECVFTVDFGICGGFSPDERYAFVLPKISSAAYRVNLEDSKKAVEVFGGHGSSYGVSSFLGANCCLTTHAFGEFILVWALDSGVVRHCLGVRLFNFSIEVVSLSRDGKFAITRGQNLGEKSKTGLWNLLLGDLIFESIEFQNDDVVMTPDQNFLLSKSLLIDIYKNRVVRRFEYHEEYCNPIYLSTNGYLVLSGNNDGSIVLWSLLTGEEFGRLRDQNNSSFSYFEISQNNKYCLSIGGSKGLQLWNLETRTLQKTLDADNKVLCASFMTGEKYIISSSEDKKVKIWFVETGQIAYEVDQSEKITSLFVSPESNLIYLGSESGVGTWELKME